eukprot:TRINITY_DN6063_c0_g1_i1.p2 TRINITY_DN6063_c0_g1~~TRINITY_DN6063_c0_g1_i1.p2  ORF type:complete len:354 (-),score=69.08 TRINITY_DN6063_c0_g1_i1:328-1389(-)
MGCGTSNPAKGTSSKNLNKFYTIRDTFESTDEVTDALRGQGLESSNLIVGLDFTKSNEWSGKYSFFGRNLHSLDPQVLNPYQEVVQIIGKTLAYFDDDKLIPTYGFGDVTTSDRYVFSFYPGDKPIYDLTNVVTRYQQIAPYINLAGPTSFAPLIRHAMKVVANAGNAYHILLIVADGQISPQCVQATVQAIVEASNYALSIIMVGVGDGPWDAMQHFDDQLPQRRFDNFQFVNFTEQMQKAKQYNYAAGRREASFALNTLMEIPEQYKLIKKLKFMDPAYQGLGPAIMGAPNALDPPQEVLAMDKQAGTQGVEVGGPPGLSQPYGQGYVAPGAPYGHGPPAGYPYNQSLPQP